MARTTSAGPRGEIALAASTASRYLNAARANAMLSLSGARGRAILGAGLLQLAVLAIALPAIEQAHDAIALLILVALALLTVMIVPSAAHVEHNAQEFSASMPDAEAHTALVAQEEPPAPCCEPQPILAPKRPTASALSPQARTDLMARVSHELRTPLNAVVGFSDLMGHELFGPLGHPRYEEYVRHIRDSGQKLLKSTEDTLAITSLLTAHGEARCEEIALGSIARDARRIATVDGPHRAISVAYDIDNDLAVMAHRRALRQILVNLLSEGMSRASEASEITVTARCCGDKVAVSVATTAAAPALRDGHASLPICLARTMIELSGGELSECDSDGIWRATTLLDRVVQPDFFLAPRVTSASAALA